MKIGEIMPADRDIVLNEGKKTVIIVVANKGDRPVQVGSHFHFLRQTSACPLTARRHMATIWIFPPERLSALSRARKRRFSSPRWADVSACLA